MCLSFGISRQSRSIKRQNKATFLSLPQYKLATDLFSKAINPNSLTFLSGDERGTTLQQYIEMGGNYANGPIGPKLKAILKSLGIRFMIHLQMPN
ncbi:39559_t:CDS:2 [Gigaspora margarita]|uniref:39559_t:CDS:1 n=1 Tax=Gigaspora margarita TaxID=4874 RepID=A0ABN7UPW7_GIGMA|nr:39559_t:CDS:2 [Gigaspora margarita]